MLPTFPTIEDYRARNVLDRIHEKSRGLAPIFNQIGAHIIHEGRRSSLARESGEVEEVKTTQISAAVTVERRRFGEFDEEELEALLDEAAEQLARGLSEMFASTMNEVTDKTGNVVDVKGEQFSEKHFFEMMDKMEHCFTEFGEWIAPTVVAGSDAEKAVRNFRLSPAGRGRLQQLLQGKLDDFRNREASRVLVG